jgi:UDPglucose 6-dehydrogenase
MSKICMVGTGYVGLVSGACLADFGHEVWCVDINQKRIDELHDGIMPIYEPGLETLVENNVNGKRLYFTTSLEEGMKDADTVFIAVQTPMADSGEADLKFVLQVAGEIGALLDDYKVIVTKSTVPVGTSKLVRKAIKDKLKSDIDFDLASNPEFLREGSSIEDFMRPDRVVVGVDSDRAADVMKEVYRPLYLLETPVVISDIETAELIKYASNAFLAVKISYINELSTLADSVGANISMVAKAMGLDKRIGKKFLHAGLGYGGSCLPKDTNALVHIAETAGCDMSIVRAAIGVNAELPGKAIDMAKQFLPNLSGKTITLLGLSFKPNTDDIREAPSRKLVALLTEAGATLRVHDPVAADNFQIEYPDFKYCENAYDAVTGSDLCMLVTEWNEYRQLNISKLGELMNNKIFIDCRNVYNKQMFSEHGFNYASFGRPERD